MEEEEHTDRKQLLARLCQKLNKFKKLVNEDNTDNINQVISSNSPESCQIYLMDLEKKADPQQDPNHLIRLMDFYTRVFSCMPLVTYGQNESYARMLVRFAELKALQDVKEAEANFNVARTNGQHFAFVHVAYAQFEHSQGNTERAISILQKALELDAEPKELLEAAFQSLQRGNAQSVCSEDKENVPVLRNNYLHESTRHGKSQKLCRNSEGTDDLQFPAIFASGSSGTERFSESSDEQLPGWRSESQPNRAFGLRRRVPIVPIPIPEIGVDNGNEMPSKENAFIPSSLSRQTTGSSTSSVFALSSSKKAAVDGDFLGVKPTTTNPVPRLREDKPVVDSTTTLLQDTRDTSRTEDTIVSFDQIINSKEPESCWAYLLKLEKRGNPQTDVNLLNKLTRCYSNVFARLPIGSYSKKESYVRMLVRYAELKGIEDPEEARDHFIVARSNCKGFAFVHVAHAQFEVSQGNVNKAASILRKGRSLNARPGEMLEVAMRILKAGGKLLVPIQEDSSPDLQNHGPRSVATCEERQDLQIPARVAVEQPKPSSQEPLSVWKMPAPVGRHSSPEDKHITTPDSRPIPHLLVSRPTPSLPLPSGLNPPVVYQTPSSYKPPRPDSYITPMLKRIPESASSVAHAVRPTQQPCIPPNQVSFLQTPKASVTALSNETITIKGKTFYILKMIGRGGSSKVYQVLDDNKQLFAVKYVNLEEADPQTVESYKNEIEHLNRLQQFSDQIIKLFDYEITHSYIYMLMECGNLDLNTLLRKRKTVNTLERKFYWKNMLEAVHTIHKHGIVHSDLKPANFVIVNASLKLIDFGIANRLQPDVTSIVKDSQVGTLNYMPPEGIKSTGSKISPKGDVWSLGCILYYMTYGKTPFQSITNQLAKLQAIANPSHKIAFPDIPERDLMNVLKRCLVRNPRERISIAELLDHPFLQFQPQQSAEPETPCNSDLRKILTDLAALQSPNSIVRAANNLAKMCSSGQKLDAADCVKTSSQMSWKM